MPITRRSLNFDFVRDGSTGGQGFLDSLFTFSRASTATRFNASGVLETVASGTPRFDFDPSTLLCRGLLIEEARTNLLLHSGDFSNAAFTGSGGGVTPNYATAPDGTNSASRYTGGAFRTQSVVVTNGQPYAVSFFAKATSGSQTVVGYDINGNSQPGVVVGSAWQRIVFKSVATSATGYCGINGAGSGDLLVWGFQIELGAFATSYIPTTTVAVARAAESCYASSVSPWIDPTKGTILAEFDAQGVNGLTYPPIVWRMGSGLWQYQFTDTQAYILIDGSSSIQPAVSAISWGTVHKFATSINGNRVAGSVNGGAVGASSAYTPSPLSMLTLGSYHESFHHINGHIRRFQYYPFAVDDITLKQMTA